MLKKYIIIISLMLMTCVQAAEWREVAKGLEIKEFKIELYSPAGDSIITILRIDPELWDFSLLTASQTGNGSLTAKQWCAKNKLTAAFNAGMFLTDYSTNVGYMNDFGHFNNPRKHPSYKSAVAFNPVKKNIPEVKIFDIDEDDFDEVIFNYRTVIQNLRLIKRPGENRWAKQEKKWSEIALGQDIDGKILLIFCKSPYSMFDLNDILLKLPINIQCAQHLEGGPEAQLYLEYEEFKMELVGGYETSFFENDFNIFAWPIPNVIGIRPKFNLKR